jgi:hypothetical protein
MPIVAYITPKKVLYLNLSYKTQAKSII